ncbi:MAG: VOC family protein [Spirochaetota bacterium]
MRIEHIAYNVADPQKVAAWYAENLGFTIERAGGEPPYAHFLADDTGGVMIEIYHNTSCAVPDYAKQDPLLLHLALVSNDAQADSERLTAAGATVADPIRTTPAGDTLCMLRDPWGFAVQLCQRAEPMVR